jgi:hypothetical protein
MHWNTFGQNVYMKRRTFSYPITPICLKRLLRLFPREFVNASLLKSRITPSVIHLQRVIELRDIITHIDLSHTRTGDSHCTTLGYLPNLKVLRVSKPLDS